MQVFQATNRLSVAVKTILLGSSILCAADAVSAEGAMGATTGALEEVIVTARQRNESLITVPVAVSSLNAKALQDYGTTDIRDVVKLAPSLTIDRASSGSGGVLSLRGVGTSPGQSGFDQAVSINIDGVQTGRARVLTQGLFDVAQVDVLKGPQALFFGKNSPAGVIAIRSAGPTQELEGYARASYEFGGDEAIIEGALSGPLSDAWGARLAVRYRDMEGWLRNDAALVSSPFAPPDPGAPVLGVRKPGEKELMGRLTLTFTPADSNFDATLKVSAMDYEDDGPAAGQQLFSCGAFSAGRVYGVTDPTSGCNFDNHYSASGLPDGVADNWPYARQQPYTDSKIYLGSLTANYRAGDLTFTSVTGYFKTETSYVDNYDATAFYQLGAAEYEKYDTFSQEFRLLTDYDAPINLMFGVFYEHAQLDFVNASKILALGVDPATGKYETWNRPGSTKTDAYSVFSQAIWDITQEVEFALGVRYTREEKDSTLANTYVYPSLSGVLFTPPSRVFTDKFRDSNYSPEATLTWRPNQDVTTYIAYKTGYKSGGFGLGFTLMPADVTEDAIRYKAEQVKGFEAGLKTQLLDRRLLLTAAVYTYKYEDLQVNSFDSATTSFIISNAAAARVKGVEVEARLNATSWLNVYGAVAYNRARYLDYVTGCWSGQTAALGCNVELAPGSFGQDLSGEPLSRAPDWTLSTGFTVDVPINDRFVFGFAGNARYSDEYFGVENSNPAGMQDSFWVFDASARIATSDEKMELAVIGRNLTDEYYSAGYLAEKPGATVTPGIPGQIMGVPARKRQIALQATYRF
ncbi:TonB-dependent receptor [Steroidobacter denitrificans]|uniref:TonB-dependent receptor n=1 Tax=Steroidobacter denitrificans TaxID=465721 RepID=UPI000A5D2D54|nr:TonB-dependent receptor [Steroidobacter denitrificans]